MTIRARLGGRQAGRQAHCSICSHPELFAQGSCGCVPEIKSFTSYHTVQYKHANINQRCVCVTLLDNRTYEHEPNVVLYFDGSHYVQADELEHTAVQFASNHWGQELELQQQVRCAAQGGS